MKIHTISDQKTWRMPACLKLPIEKFTKTWLCGFKSLLFTLAQKKKQ